MATKRTLTLVLTTISLNFSSLREGRDTRGLAPAQLINEDKYEGSERAGATSEKAQKAKFAENLFHALR